MKKIFFLIIFIFGCFFSLNMVEAASIECTSQSAAQLAKILYREVGGTVSTDIKEDAFVKFVTASVILNNATTKNGSTTYAQLYNLTNSNYANYSTYKDKDFQNVVPSSHQAKMLYIAEMVLTGKFSVPKEINLQASKSIVERYSYENNSWYNIENVYFGHEKALSNKSVLGTTVSINPEDYLDLAGTLLAKDYSNYSLNNVCKNTNYNQQNESNNVINNDNHSNVNNDANIKNEQVELEIEICKDPGVLRVIYILKMIITIVKVLVPILIIVMATKNLITAVLENDDKKINSAVHLLIVRFIIGVFIYFIPTIIMAILSLLGNLYNKDNITECINNATREKIDYYDNLNKSIKS